MGDLFHEDVPTKFIADVWSIMYHTWKHTFQILTKRPRRMAQFVKGWNANAQRLPSNIHLGVTAENQKTADERIPVLLAIPAAFRFVSLEPLLGEIDLRELGLRFFKTHETYLNLVIVGGETGPGARPMHPAWPRSLRDQCAAAGVTFHFKSWGEWLHESQFTNDAQRERALSCKRCDAGDGFQFVSVGAKAAGHLLDGVEHRGLPE